MQSLDVVVLPALGVGAGRYARLVAALRDHGLRAHVVDLQPLTVPGGRRGAGYEQLVLGPVTDAVRAAGGDGPPLVLGHSLGAQLAVLLAAHEPAALGGVVVAAGGTVHWRAQGSPAAQRRVLLGTRAVAAVSAVLGRWPGERLGFGGDQNGRLMREWARAARRGTYPAVAGRAHEPARVAAPQLLLHVPGDTDAPPPAGRALLADTAGATSEVTLDPEDFGRHVDHLRWLAAPGPVAAAVAGWWATRER